MWVWFACVSVLFGILRLRICYYYVHCRCLLLMRLYCLLAAAVASLRSHSFGIRNFILFPCHPTLICFLFWIVVNPCCTMHTYAQHILLPKTKQKKTKKTKKNHFNCFSHFGMFWRNEWRRLVCAIVMSSSWFPCLNCETLMHAQTMPPIFWCIFIRSDTRAKEQTKNWFIVENRWRRQRIHVRSEDGTEYSRTQSHAHTFTKQKHTHASNETNAESIA